MIICFSVLPLTEENATQTNEDALGDPDDQGELMNNIFELFTVRSTLVSIIKLISGILFLDFNHKVAYY